MSCIGQRDARVGKLPPVIWKGCRPSQRGREDTTSCKVLACEYPIGSLATKYSTHTHIYLLAVLEQVREAAGCQGQIELIATASAVAKPWMIFTLLPDCTTMMVSKCLLVLPNISQYKISGMQSLMLLLSLHFRPWETLIVTKWQNYTMHSKYTQKLLTEPNTLPKHISLMHRRTVGRMTVCQTFYQSVPSSKVHKQQKDEEYIDL